VANLITRAGADRVLTMDLHAAQIQGFFDIPVDNMLGNPLFTRYYMSKFDEKLFNHDEFCVVSPDVGSVAPARSRPRSTWALPSWTSAVSAPTCARS